MKYRKRLLAALILITAFGLGAAGIERYLQLDQPVFLDAYISMQADKDGNLDQPFILKYITNANDTRSVGTIRFPESPDGYLCYYPGESNTNDSLNDFFPSEFSENTIGSYKVHTVSITVRPQTKSSLKEAVSLHRAIITYTNGNTQTVSVGNIVIHPYTETKNVVTADYKNGTQDENQYTSYGDIWMQEPITLMNLTSLLPENLSPCLKCSLNGMDSAAVAGTVCAVNSQMNIKTTFSFDESLLGKYADYDMPVFFRYRDASGNEGQIWLDTITYTPSFSDYPELIRYLNARGAL